MAGARLAHERPRCDRAAIRFLPALLQGRSALHRLRAKGRGHAESRRQAVIAMGYFAVIAARAGDKDLSLQQLSRSKLRLPLRAEGGKFFFYSLTTVFVIQNPGSRRGSNLPSIQVRDVRL